LQPELLSLMESHTFLRQGSRASGVHDDGRSGLSLYSRQSVVPAPLLCIGQAEHDQQNYDYQQRTGCGTNHDCDVRDRRVVGCDWRRTRRNGRWAVFRWRSLRMRWRCRWWQRGWQRGRCGRPTRPGSDDWCRGHRDAELGGDGRRVWKLGRNCGLQFRGRSERSVDGDDDSVDDRTTAKECELDLRRGNLQDVCQPLLERILIDFVDRQVQHELQCHKVAPRRGRERPPALTAPFGAMDSSIELAYSVRKVDVVAVKLVLRFLAWSAKWRGRRRMYRVQWRVRRRRWVGRRRRRLRAPGWTPTCHYTPRTAFFE